MKNTLGISTLAILCAMATAPAFAQSQINPSVTAEKTAEKAPAKAPKGYMVGNVRVKPTIAVTEEYNDNIYTEENNEVGDYITRIVPKIAAELENSPHQLKLNAGLEQVFYADETQNHHLNFDASLSDRFNFDKTSYINANLGYRKRHSLPGDDDANPGADAGEPIPYSMYDAGLRFSKDFGALDIVPNATFRRYEFQNVRRIDGVMLDQGYRDRDEFSFGGRANLELNKQYKAFIDADFKPIDYLQSSATERDSDGGNYLAGLRWSPDKTLSLEAGLGYLNRKYDTAGYDDIGTLGATVSFVFAPKPGTKATFDYDRSIIEVTDTGVGGAIRDDLKASFSKDLTDLWSGRLTARYANTDYEGGLGSTSGTEDREDDYYSVGAGLSYDLTQSVAFTADYTYGNNQSNRDTADYDQNVFLLGVKAGF